MATLKRSPTGGGISMIVLVATLGVGVMSLIYASDASRDSAGSYFIAAALAFGFACTSVWRE